MILTTISTLFSKALNFGIITLTIPLTISYLGKERFGVWMTLSSALIVMSIFSDIGLGIALQNKTSKLYHVLQRQRLRLYTSTSFFLLIGISTLLITIGVPSVGIIDWRNLLHLKESATIDEIDKAISIMILMFAINLPFTIIDKFQEGLQKGYLTNAWTTFGNFLSLLGLLSVIKMKLGLPELVGAYLAGSTIVRVINFAWRFYFTDQWAAPSIVGFSKKLIKSLLGVGSTFFVLNVFNIFGMHSDNFVISGMLGAREVSLYGILQKISMIATVFWSFTTALWPAYAEAISRGDVSWVKKTIRRNFQINVILGLVFGGLIVGFGKLVVFYLGQGMVEPSYQLLIGFALYIFVNGLIGSVAVLFNSSFLYRKQVPFFVLASTVSLGLKFILISNMGVIGVVLATVLGYGLFYVVPGVIIIKRTFWETPILRFK